MSKNGLIEFMLNTRNYIYLGYCIIMINKTFFILNIVEILAGVKS